MEITFTSLGAGTREEYQYLETTDHGTDMLVEELLALFRTTDRDNGYALNPMQHALQTATRALRDQASDEWVVAALFHDIADVISPTNHARVAAEILRPYVPANIHWAVAHHSVFQGFYYWHHVGKDRNAREVYRDHAYFNDCAMFCEKWDQISFDPDYDTLPLAAFMPIIERVFKR